MKARYAIAVSNFAANEELIENAGIKKAPCCFLNLIAGDRICVYAERDGWAVGSRVGSRADAGLFPLIAVKFVNRHSQTDPTAEGANIVEEISQVTQTWWRKIKEIYAKHSDMHYIQEVLDFIDYMLTVRQKILSGGVPLEELNSLRTQLAKKIDRGNMLLSLNVTIRDERGLAFDPDSISFLQTYTEHQNAQKRVALDSSKVDANEKALKAFCVLLRVQSIELQMKHNCEISMVLYDFENKRHASDTFTFIWKCNETNSRDLNISGLFANFNQSDIGRRFALITRVAHIAPVEHTSSTLKRNQEPGPSSLYCRQAVAFDFFDMTSVFANPQPSHDAKERVIFLNKDQNFDQSLKYLQTTTKVPKLSTSSDDAKILVSTQVFTNGLQELKLRRPYLFTRNPPTIVSRCDYAGPASGDVRNELYITLVQGEFSSKSSDRNIEARMHLVEGNGRIIPDCFETVSAGSVKLSSDYRSFVYIHEDKPLWFENVKVHLPEDISRDLHLRITFHSRKPYDKGKPEKGPFALAHIRLMCKSVLVPDGDHELLVYKIESSHYDDNNTSYLPLPQTKRVLRDLGNTTNKPHSSVFSLSEKSFVLINTLTCSTLLTQNEHILSVLGWRESRPNLNSSLIMLAAPFGDTQDEMIRFLCPLLDALFDLWDEREQLELAAFDVIVALFKLTEEQINSAAADTLKKYLDRFPYCNAAVKLMRCLNHYIASASTVNNEKTRNLFKVLGLVFRTVVQSKRSGDNFFDDENYTTKFRMQLDSVLDSLVDLMGETRERMTVQNTALKHLPAIVDPICASGAYEPTDLCKFFLRVMNGFGKNIVARERLGLVSQLIDTHLFELQSCRAILLPRCMDLVLVQLDPDLSEEREFADRAMECASIVARLLERLFPATTSPPYYQYGTDEELNFILGGTYRPLVQAMVYIGEQHLSTDEIRGRFFSLILALLNKMSAELFGKYIESRPNDIDKMDFILEMLQMIRDLLCKCPFPSTWQQMIMLQNKTVHKALRFLMNAIQGHFSNERESFYSDIWQEYMVTAVCFVTQPSLQSSEEWLRDEADSRIQLRKATARDLRSMWFRLTPVQKMAYIPRLVGAFLKVALVEDDETREATIPIFFDMMQCEFHSCIEDRKNFKKFSDELITQLDSLVDQDRGTRAFQEQFSKILKSQCQSDKELWEGGGRELIDRVDRLLGHLFEYRLVRETSDCMENGMSRTVQLLRYYEKYKHHNLYITYVYKLYNLHMTYNNQIEAARTLLLYAKTLSWNDTELDEWLIAKRLNRHCAVERQLKDSLLCEAADLFAEGEMWEDAIKILKELLPVYEVTYVDYDKLASLMVRIAELYRKIDRENRAFFYYYLVAFYGKGFPSYLNGISFVFRSDKLERHADFMQRMQQIYGGPEAIMSMDDCSHLKNSPGRYMQVFNVDPIPTACPFKDAHVNPSIKDYYRHYNIRDFEYSRVEERKDTKWTTVKDSELMRTWIVKRTVVTYERLPGILRSTQIISTSPPIYVNPLRRSVDQMQRKNTELMETALLVLLNRIHAVKKLSGEILGVVRPAVMGGVSNYEVFFSDECSRIYDSEEKQLAMHLSALIIEQVEILEFCLYAHATRTEITKQFHDHLVEGFYEHKQYVEDKFGRTRSILPEGASIRYSVESNGIDASKKTVSSTSLDSSSTGTLNLRSRGAAIGSTMLSMLTTSRKSSSNAVANSATSSPSAVSSNRTISVDAARVFASIRDNNVDSLRSSDHSNKRPTIDGLEGIRLRSRARRSLDQLASAPPLPPRGHAVTNDTSSDDRSMLNEQRHNKSPIPTPITDLGDLQRF
ncbi:Dedicator of cytokinesis protein 1 [Trichostrongylus colubriformis]|uniref:Dedicator of cytokinesis protein 1 n=1 Tax=Trichostrongylus colubriformis TaxID=6319 RepID=A0AAN8IRK2_TRICO